MKNISNIILMIFLLPILHGCKSSSNQDLVISLKRPEGDPIAQVGSMTLTVEELAKKFQERQGSFRGAAYLNTEKKRAEFVESAVVKEVLFQAALKGGVAEDPEVIEAFKDAAVRKWVQKMLKDAQANFKATDEEMKEYYEKNQSFFKHEEAFKVAYLAVPKGKDNNKAKEIAQSLQVDAAKNVKNSDTREFARLAMKFAQESKGKNQGHFSITANESPYLEQEAFDNKFGKDSFKTVKAIEPLGSVGPILSTDDAYYVFMKTGHRAKLDEGFDAAKDKIQKRLSFEKRGKIYEDFIASEKEKLKVKIYEEKIAKLSEGMNEQNVAQAEEQAAGSEVHNHPH